jgi:fructose-specific phosphotransferase system IIA component
MKKIKEMCNMRLSDLMTSELVKLDLQGLTKDAIMDEMIAMLEGAHTLNDPAAFKAALYHREAEGSTGIGFGIAIPHGKSDAVKVPCVAFGIKKAGVDWDSLDDEDANLVFMIAVPETHAGNEHLKILQMLSRKLIDDEFRESLLQASSVEEIMALVDSIE